MYVFIEKKNVIKNPRYIPASSSRGRVQSKHVRLRYIYVSVRVYTLSGHSLRGIDFQNVSTLITDPPTDQRPMLPAAPSS